MRGTRHLVSGHVNASLRTFKRSATSKSYKSLESEVLRLPTSAHQMKAALMPRSYVEKIGQCTWGKNLLLLCSHPSDSVLIVSMNAFKLAMLKFSASNVSYMPWTLSLLIRKVNWALPGVHQKQRWSLNLGQSTFAHCSSPQKCALNAPQLSWMCNGCNLNCTLKFE